MRLLEGSAEAVPRPRYALTVAKSKRDSKLSTPIRCQRKRKLLQGEPHIIHAPDGFGDDDAFCMTCWTNLLEVVNIE